MALLLPTSKCVVPAYDERTANLRKRQVTTFMRLRCRTRYCTDCEAFHVVYHDEYAPMDERHKAVLEKIAMGLRDHEIASDLQITTKQVEHAINRIMSRLNAMSRPNLVAIAIALGIINPSAFIAAVTQENHVAH